MENEVVQSSKIDESIPSDDYQLMIVAGSKEKASKGLSSNRSLFMIPVDKLQPMPGFNARIKNAKYWEKVQEIADSQAENGFYTDKPISCYVIKQEGNDVIVYDDGHRRIDAVKVNIERGINIELVPCVIRPATNLTDMTVRLVTANSGEQLTPMEIAIVCKRLQGYGLDNATIAKRLAFSVAYVGQLLSLTAAPQQIIDLVQDEKISATLAVDTIRNEGEAAVKVLTEAVEVAQSQGKDKATKKHLKATDKPSKVTTDEPASNPTVAPVLQTVQATPEPHNTPFNALIAAEAVSHSEAVMLEKGINWLKGNIGIIDQSHYELMQALFSGSTMDSLKELVE